MKQIFSTLACFDENIRTSHQQIAGGQVAVLNTAYEMVRKANGTGIKGACDCI